MTLDIKKENETALIAVEGRVDSQTAPEFQSAVLACAKEVEAITLDCSSLAYISSAGLRCILKLYKEMKNKGGLKLTGVRAEVLEIFEMTGFSDFLDIQ